MERGIGLGDIHIAVLIGMGQWVGYLIGSPQNLLILTSSTQLSKISYLTLELISYCNLLLIWLSKKMCHVHPPS